MQHETVLALIERIYDAALDRAALPDALLAVGEAMGCAQECLHAEPAHRDAFAMIAPRRDPIHIDTFNDYRTQSDGGVELMRSTLMAPPPGWIGEMRQLLKPGELRSHAFFVDWLRRQGVGLAGLGFSFATSTGTRGICGVHKPASGDEFNGEEIALFRAVIPHLARVIAIQDKLAALALDNVLEEGISGHREAVILVDAARHILFANKSAETILAGGRGMCVDAGTLTLADPSAAAEFGRLVASSSDLRVGGRGRGGSMVVRHPSARAPIKVDVMPYGAKAAYRDAGLLGVFRPAALVVIRDLEREREARRRDLQTRFGLTPAEADVALEILKGDGRSATAARLDISLSTVRMHLSRIFHKMGINRQAELVRLLSGEPGETRIGRARRIH